MRTILSFLTTAALILMLGFFSCGDDSPAPPPAEGTVYFNGNIYTVNPNQPWAEAVYVKAGLIEFVGSDAATQAAAPEGVEMVDLNGRFMMPGIHDVHTHPLEASTNNFQFTVDGEEEDPENYQADVLAAIQNTPGNGWLLGWGHKLGTILAATRAPKAILDEVAPDRPVAIMEQTSHSIWCNAKALEMMGITAASTDPAGGIIMRDSTGMPNGLLFDNAGNLLIELALQPTPQSEQNDYQGLIEFGLPELAKHGITSICDARTYWKRNHHKIWQRLADEEKLTARVTLGLWAYPAEDDTPQIAMLKSLYSNESSSLLKINQIKLYSDGIIHNTTAAMKADYLVDYFGQTPNNGLNYFTEQRIANYLQQLEGTGFDFHIHALGNRGIHEGLNAIEQSGTAAGRHRLTHVEFLDPADIGRFAQLNVTADAQVAGDFTNPSQWFGNAHLIGAALSDNIIPLKSLKQANARITLSSDWDVSSVNPFVGMQNAVTRSPQELSLEDAISAYTINAAYVMRQEDKVGTIEVGKEADMILLDRNPFDLQPNQLSKIKVLETYLQGRLVYER